MRLNSRSLLFLICSILASPLSSSGQDLAGADWHWSEFTTESGLPSDHIYYLAETKDSTTWVGTGAGYAWYDGYRWNLADTSSGLKARRAWGMSLYGRDTLIGILDGHIHLGDKHGFRDLGIGVCERVLALTDHSLLVRKGASLFMYSAGRLEPFEPDSQLTRGKTFDILSAGSGSPYVLLANSLYRVEGSRLKCVLSSPIGRLRIISLSENDAGTLIALVSTPIELRGLVQIKDGTVSFLRKWQSGNYAIAADISENGDVVVATESGSLDIISHGAVKHLSPPFMGFRTVECLNYRPNGDIWVGTNRGLYLYRKTVPPWTYLPRDSLGARNRIHEIIRRKNGDLWTATAYGLVVYHADGTREIIDRINGSQLTEVTGLIEDNDDNIWITSGAGFTGAYRLDSHGWRHFPVSESPAGVRFHKIKKDRRGRLWFLGLSEYVPLAGAEEPGAFVYDGGTFTRWGTAEGLVSGHVYSFDEAPDGSLVFGTLRGLCRWKNGRWQYWAKSHLIAGNMVFAIDIDKDGTVWECDRNDGVEAILPDGKVVRYTTHDGLLDNAVWDVKIGPDERIWFTTDEGLACYDHGKWSAYTSRSGLAGGHLWPVLPLEDKVYVGTQFAGVAVLNLNTSAQSYPRIYLENAIVDGNTAHVRWTASMPWNEIPQQEILTRHRIDKQPWSPWSSSHAASYERLSATGHTFEVQAMNLFGTYDPAGAQTGFSIPLPFYARPEFLIPVLGSTLASAGFGAQYLLRRRKHAAALQASEAKFRRLTEATFEGVIIHDRGVILDANQSILSMLGYTHDEFIGTPAFSFLAPESREAVENIAMSDSGAICEAVGIRKDGSRISVEVIGKTIPYDNRSAGVAAIRDITERKRAEEKLVAYQSQLRSLALELEATEERERRRMATYLHDYIGQSLALCKIKLGAVPAPPLPTHQLAHLQEIRAVLDQMIENTHSLTFELSPPVLYELGFEEAIEWLTEQIHQQHGLSVSYENDDEPKPLRDEVKVLLFHAVRELLVNVVKHAYARHAGVYLKRISNTLVVLVEDDGIGLREQPESGRTSGRTQGGTPDAAAGGFGLFNIRERIAPLGGRIEISSVLGKGTRIVLTVPLLS